MSRNSGNADEPNWRVIAVLVGLAVGMLAAGYYLSSYWQGIFVNGGTALFLSAGAVFFEPRLVRHLREPRDLEEALARFSLLSDVGPAGGTASSSHSQVTDQVKGHVLRLVGRTGLHQEPPDASLVRFEDLSGSMGVKWCVQWDKMGIAHSVTVRGKSIPSSMGGRVAWNRQLAAHDDRIYKILCYLIRELDSSARIQPSSTAAAAAD